MKKFLICGLVALACAMCSSCMDLRWVHAGPRALDARAKSFSVSPGLSNIYVVYVGKHWWAGGVGADVFLDGVRIGTVSKSNYHLLEVRHGEHSIGEGWQYVQKTLMLTTEPGKSYFVRISEHGGSWARQPGHSIEIVDEEVGRNLVLKSKLAGEYRGIVR